VRLSAVRDERYDSPTLRHTSPSYRSYRSHPRPPPECYLVFAREPRPIKRLLLLKRPMNQSSFEQPKNEPDDRVDDELIEIYKKSRG
jgi:hypothetical protein